MNSITSFAEYDAQLRATIRHCSVNPTLEDAQFNSLGLALFRLQFETVPCYRKICEQRKLTPASVEHWLQIPALPTSTFKEFEVTSLPETERIRFFNSSGTTAQRPSRHFHSTESLALYECSLLPWYERHLLPDLDQIETERPGMIFLTPEGKQVPHSSLVHMFETAQKQFGASDSVFGGKVDAEGAWQLDVDRVVFALRKSMCGNRPLILHGTAFSFVHLLDHFDANNMRYRLATGSRVLETGGYKGRSRNMPKQELHKLITRHLGISSSHIVTEYGMSELSSQAYDHVTGENPAGALYFPPWARSVITNPETGALVAEGETGLVRIFDLANARSVLAVQTEDLGIRRGNGFELLGRAGNAEPRGCSLMSIDIPPAVGVRTGALQALGIQ